MLFNFWNLVFLAVENCEALEIGEKPFNLESDARPPGDFALPLQFISGSILIAPGAIKILYLTACQLGNAREFRGYPGMPRRS